MQQYAGSRNDVRSGASAVLMSGYRDTPDAPGDQGGILRLLPKPFTASGLLATVTDVLSEDQ